MYDKVIFYGRYSRYSYEEALAVFKFTLVLFVIFIALYLYLSSDWRPLRKYFIPKGDLCKKCGKPLHMGADSCKWCGEKVLGTYAKPKPQTKRFLKKDNICLDCGNEMEYRDNMDSWFCQTCRTYK